MIKSISMATANKVENKISLTKEQAVDKMLASAKGNNFTQFKNSFDPKGEMKNIALSKELPGDPDGPATKLMKELKEKFDQGYYLRQRGEIIEVIEDSPYFPCFAADVKLNKTPAGYKIDYIRFWK